MDGIFLIFSSGLKKILLDLIQGNLKANQKQVFFFSLWSILLNFLSYVAKRGYVSKLASVVEGDQKVHFSIATSNKV